MFPMARSAKPQALWGAEGNGQYGTRQGAENTADTLLQDSPHDHPVKSPLQNVRESSSLMFSEAESEF